MRARVAATAGLLLYAATALAPVGRFVSLARADRVPAVESDDASVQPPTNPLFDPERHMRVSQVRTGMKGYGLSVFAGTKIEKFDVEVLSVLKNFNPKYDVVLITCKGANLEHTGAIAGMSGSPIFLTDDQGHDRMIGAFAYGWPLTKDPIAGVQPIEYMLTLPAGTPAHHVAGGPTTAPTAAAAIEREDGPGIRAEPRAAWGWSDAVIAWQRLSHPASPEAAAPTTVGRIGMTGGDAPRLQPLATPLMTSGISPAVLDQLGPALRSAGLVPMQAGVGGSGVASEPAALLEPGSVLAVPLLTGDTELTAIGTVTETRGDRVFGFGHAFNNEGSIALPMGSGRINGIVANLTTSFKLGSLTQLRGVLSCDQTVGVAGHQGNTPTTIPIDLDITDVEGQSRHYHFDGAVHPKFTPLICSVAFSSAVSGVSDLPQYNTVDYVVNVEFANGRKISVLDLTVNATPMDLFQGIGLAITAASENPFERVMVRKITGTVKVSPQVRSGQILEVNVPRLKYRPGETIKGFVSYKPFRSEEAIMPVELELPHDVAQGTYQLVISDADRYFQDEQATKPFRFTAEKGSDVFDVLKDVSELRHNALYVRLMRRPDGVAVGRTAMPQLPSSRRQILLGAGRSNTTAFATSTVKIIPTDRVMTGSAEFQIQVEMHGKGEGGVVVAPTSRPSVLPHKAETARPPKSGPMDAPKPKEKQDGE